MIRENVLKYKRYLPDIVYSDLITKVAFVGFDWASKNKLINKLAKKNNIISGPLCLEPSNEKTIRQLIRRNSRKLYENKRLKGANLFAFWGNTLIECFVLLNGTQRIYQSDIKEEAIKQIRDFDIVFTNFNSDKNVNCVNSDFLNNQLISLLTTNAINYISLEGTLTQKENSAKKAIDLNLKNKRFI